MFTAAKMFAQTQVNVQEEHQKVIEKIQYKIKTPYQERSASNFVYSRWNLSPNVVTFHKDSRVLEPTC